MKKYTSVNEFLKDYEEHPEWFNMMVDVQSIQDVGPLYKPVISMKFLDVGPDGGDIYIQKNAGKDFFNNDYKETRYSITRQGLLKIASAARYSFSNPVSEYNLETKSYTCITTMTYIGSKEGEWLSTTCSKEVACIKKGTRGAYDNSDPVRKAESGAQNACIRQAFSIRGHYSMEQVKKPFTIFYWELDEMKDQRILEARINKGIFGTQLLYGGRKPLQLVAPENVDMETGEILEGEKGSGK